ncbi:MAG TPA: serine/threonine-protein kinase [Verrucomicrobiae bacterium]
MNSSPEELLFALALSKPVAERASFLDRECANDSVLRARLDKLLAAHEQSEGVLEETAPVAGGTMKLEFNIEPEDEAVGQVIGRYKVLEKVGEGGCGMVYVAEQTEPVRRRVALKVIKLGMDTKQVVVRFETERQALAMMDHPNIAKVLDAGTTEQGRPYFVMELVRGIKITDYCDQEKISTQDRLDLFIKVCHAIQHAHQKGIIHRDIKPSNILVTLHDGGPVPKVIDFGIAKATEGRLTDATVYTQLHQFIGTPAYMSPEQAEMSGLDIDTRSDIYSLGVLLYELLTGQTPFDGKELMSMGLDAMRKTIREKEPARPSTKLATLPGNDLTTTAKRHSVDTSRLLHQLRGDLDWIVMKCLEKDRTRRYETANGLAADLKRHLSNEPVVARPPSAVYRFQKAWRRNKVVYSAAMTVVVALIIGIAVSSWQAGVALRARNEAVAAKGAAVEESAKARAAETRADRERSRAETGERAALQRAYAADIYLAQHALTAGDFGQVHNLLNGWADSDLCGWEWRYLWQRSRSEALGTLCRVSGWAAASVAASPDGRWLAIVELRGYKTLVRLWDRARAIMDRELPSTGKGLAKPIFGPVGAVIAYPAELVPRTNEFGVLILDLQTQRQIAELPTGVVAGMAFNEDGSILAACDNHRTVSRWQIHESHQLSSFSFRDVPGFRDGNINFAATRDARIVAVAHYHQQGNLLVIDLDTGKHLWQVPITADDLCSLQFSPDGRLLAAGPGLNGSSLRLFDAASGSELGSSEGRGSRGNTLTFWPDGRKLASAGCDQAIRVWDTSDPAHVPPPRVLRGHGSEVFGLALLPDGKTLVSGSKDSEVCLWDTEANLRSPGTACLTSSNLMFWGFATDGRSMVAVDLQALELVEWRGEGFAPQRTPMALSGRGACWSRDGRWLAIGGTNGTVQLWELPAKVLRAQFSVGTNPVAPLQFHTNNRRLALVTGDSFKRFEIWEWSSQGQSVRKSLSRLIPSGFELFDRTSRGPNPAGFELAPDLSQVLALDLSADQDETRVWLWSPADDQRLELGRFIGMTGVGFSPDGALVAASSINGLTAVWDRRTGQERKKLGGFVTSGAAVTFSPDSTRLVVGGREEGLIKVWDVQTWRELVTLPIAEGACASLKFSPDGNSLGASIGGGVLRFWRVPAGDEIAAAEAKAKTKQP